MFNKFLLHKIVVGIGLGYMLGNLVLGLAFAGLNLAMFKAFFVGLLYLLLPWTLSAVFSWRISLAYLASFLGLTGLGFLLSAGFSVVFTGLLSLALLVKFAQLWQTHKTGKPNIGLLLGLGALFSMFFGLEVFMVERSYVYLPHIYDEIILKGRLDQDSAMHMAVIESLRSWQMPSTGLHGAPYFHYHYLGHILYAGFVGLAGGPAFETYFFVPAFFSTVLVVLAISFVALFYGGIWAVALMPVLMFGPFWGEMDWWRSIDPTFPFAVALFVSVASVVQRQQPLWVWALLTPVFFLAKVSVGLLWFGYAFIGMIVRAPRWPTMIWIVAMAGGAAAGLLAVRQPGRTKSMLGWDWFTYFERYLKDMSFFERLLDAYSSILLAIILGLLTLVGRRKLGDWLKEFWPIPVVGLGVIASTLLFMHLQQEGGSQRFFFEIGQWFFLPIAAAFAMRCHGFGGWRRFFAAGLVALLFVGSAKQLSGRVRAYASYEQAFRKAEQVEAERRKIDFAEHARQFKPYGDALLALRENRIDRQWLVQYPRDVGVFTNHAVYPHPRWWTPFLVPVLSGLPAWEGYYAPEMRGKRTAWYPVGAYGYKAYQNLNWTDPCQDAGAQGLYRLDESGPNPVFLPSGC